jgi:hypothetical protein
VTRYRSDSNEQEARHRLRHCEPTADRPGLGSKEGRRSIGTLRSRTGLWGEPVDHSLVETSIAAWLGPEPISILRGWACSATGSVTVRTPWS